MANSVNWTDLIPWLHADLPGCGDALKIQKIRDTVIDFCHDAQAWRFWLDPISIEADVGDYDLLTIPDCAVIDTILCARQSNSDADNQETAGRLLVPGRDYLVTSTKDIFRFVRTPKQAVESTSDTTGLLIKVALKPTKESVGLEDESFDRVWDDWRDTLVAGTLGRLQGMPKKTWSNPAEAADNMAMYLAGRTKARIEVNRASLNVGLRAVSQRKWAVR